MPLDTGWDLSCPDWWERLQAGRSPIPDLPIDRKAAARALDVFGGLRLPDVPPYPTLDEACAPWVRDIVAAAFGSVDRKSGLRHVGELFVLVPKKNGKSTIAAAMALTFMLLNKRRNARLLIIGPRQKIAQTAFDQAKGMIEADPEGFLQERFDVRAYRKEIACRVTGAVLEIRTFDTDVLTGGIPVFCLLDEIHELGERHDAADVLAEVRGGMITFPQSLFVMITTQSKRPPEGIFKAELARARRIRDREWTEATRMLPVIYEFPAEMQLDETRPWADPENWHLVNPSMGRSFDLARLRTEFARAREDGPAEISTWGSKHLNVEIGIALHADRWVGADFWEGAARPGLDLEAILASSDVCTVGIDGGGLDDLLGLAVLGRHAETRAWQLWAHAWAKPIVLERRKEIAPKLRDLERAGDVTICKTPTQDKEELVEIVRQVQEARRLPRQQGIGLDTAEAPTFVQALGAAGFAQPQLCGVRQGGWLNGAIKAAERGLADGSMVHGGQGLMAWCVGNAKAELSGNATKITKAGTGKAKIDPLIAAFNAVELMARNPEAETDVAEMLKTRGLL
ncbi:terminase large subunit [Paralimibaculum aggregatum]|uniref:Terminase large subunit n=1 Tax=Paralimibaculum aggregatum TaxID=3036245 RepID=A0ABQ6LK35_9RHOB|nr:terminase large subunit [Limibaculum sp. NKW23]GMG82595.1 terminase large subunit [Limibaculum sp. NKW23]